MQGLKYSSWQKKSASGETTMAAENLPRLVGWLVDSFYVMSAQ
jgi:hypothetical protein